MNCEVSIMALIKCPECGKQISDKALTCIHCGYPISCTSAVANNQDTSNSSRSKKMCPNCKKEIAGFASSCIYCGFHDYKRDGEILHRLAIEERAERENRTVEEIEKEIEERERNRKEVISTSSSMPPVPNIDSQEYIDNCDIPGAMDDGVALLFYIVVMVVGAIFKDRWLIWIVATVVYLCHVFRRQIHKAKWEREHKNKK